MTAINRFHNKFSSGYALRVFPAETRLTVYRRYAVRWRLWARLNFCIGGHLVKIGRCFEIFKNFENSKGSRIVFPYTCDYCGAACSTPIVWGAFFESKKYPRMTSKWTLYERENLNRLEITAQIDLGAVPGRKSSHGLEIDSQTIWKTPKIRKMRKSRKAAKKCRIQRFFDFKYSFWLCWRSK